MLRALMVAVVLALAAPAAAQTQTDGQMQRIADGFFTSLKAGEFVKAYQDIWRGTPMDKKQADVEAMITQTGSAFQLYGKMDGWETVSEETVAPSFRRHTYLVRTDVGPLFFRMQFYRRASGWSVYRLDFADQLSRLP
jgi:hypothetical protein